MNMLREIVIIFGALAISIVAGCFLCFFIEGIRLDLYCKEMREGYDCYQEDWVTFPVWLLSLAGSFVSILSISIVSAVTSSPRARSSRITLGIGSVLAIPFTLILGGAVVFLVTVLSGFLALLVTQWLTSCSKKKILSE